MERFVQSGYVALRWALPFHAAARAADLPNGPVMIGCGGARGPGKSHAILAQVGIDDCQRFPGLKWLFLRKVAKSAQESFEDLISRVFGHQPHKYTPSTGFLEFANGSRIRFGGFNHENDIDGYLGIQYDGIIIEEMTQLSERKVDMIRGSLRTSRPDWRPRLYGSTNPGGVGHGYYKRTFVQPYRNNQQDKTRFFPTPTKIIPSLRRNTGITWKRCPACWGKPGGTAAGTFLRARRFRSGMMMCMWFSRSRSLPIGCISARLIRVRRNPSAACGWRLTRIPAG